MGKVKAAAKPLSATQLPTPLPPLRSDVLRSSVPPKKSKADSSLAGLSLKVEGSARLKTGTRLKPPAGPPRHHEAAPIGAGPHTANTNKRHAVDQTDHDVEIMDAYTAPPRLPTQQSSDTIDLSDSTSELWEEPEVGANSFKRSTRSTILTALAIFSVAALGLGVCAYVSNSKTSEASVHSAQTEGGQFEQAAPAPGEIKHEEAPVAETGQASASASAMGPLSAEMIAPNPSMSQGNAKLSSNSKAKRARARRLAKRKARQNRTNTSLDSAETFR